MPALPAQFVWYERCLVLVTSDKIPDGLQRSP
jgi:hypothetical protein